MSTTTYVTALPACDFCKGQGTVKEATYDGRTAAGVWANMCRFHFDVFGLGLGTGKGQELIVGTAPERNRAQEVKDAIASGDWEAMEDAVGDGDLMDYI